MRFPVKTTIALVVVGAIGFGGCTFIGSYLKGLRKVKYREGDITRGSITVVVNSTGTVQPVLSISVGTPVSGPIRMVYVDFNDDVEEGDLLASIDPLLYKSAMAQAEATLAVQQAQLLSARSTLEKAKNDWTRAQALHKENKAYISAADLDQYRFTWQSLEAQVGVAKANVKLAEASRETAKTNLGYTKIRSPVAGRVINRKIDPGQTLAAAFQTPEMFIVAPNMRKEMYILAAVDEADIGQIMESKDKKLPVNFTVDTYPDTLFPGTIFQVRLNYTSTSNVVTYPVVISTPNPDLKLTPGMTANISFQTAEVKNVLRIPNGALRFLPRPDQVRPEDRKILEGVKPETVDDADNAQAKLSAKDKADIRQQRHYRFVWVEDGDLLRAVQVLVGLSDAKNTQLISGDLTENQKVVTGIQTE